MLEEIKGLITRLKMSTIEEKEKIERREKFNKRF